MTSFVGQQARPLTMVNPSNLVEITVGGAATTVALAAGSLVVDGLLVAQGAITAATIDKDGNTNDFFKPLTANRLATGASGLEYGQRSVFVVHCDGGSAFRVTQGSIVNINSANELVMADVSFGALVDDWVPVGYIVVDFVGDGTVGKDTWQFGRDQFSATGVTEVSTNVVQLPSRLPAQTTA